MYYYFVNYMIPIMTTINKIFSKGKLINNANSSVQKVKYNRDYLISKKTAEEFNTYLNFGIFPTFSDTYTPKYKEVEVKDSNGKVIKKEYVEDTSEIKIGTPGVRSLFNRAGAVLIGSKDGDYNIDITDGKRVNDWRIGNNVPLMDSPESRQRIRKVSGCSVKELVQASSEGILGRETYSYSDFMYCKHLGKVSNNYMITLRRFPLPVDDFIGAEGVEISDRIASSSKNASCIGCMVTWLGVSGNEMSNILKYNFKMPFKEETAGEQDMKGSADENQTMLNSMFSIFDQKYREQYQAGYAGEAANAALGKAFNMFGVKQDLLGNPPYKDIAGFRDGLKVYGPIDSIRSTYIRSDEGLTFEHNITLTFEYELRSYNGVNPRQAMLDLISNILNVTYTTGSFWGGGYKGFAAHQSNIFANLNIFKARGGFTNFIDAFAEDLNDLSSGIRQKYGDGKGGFNFKTILQTLNSIGGMIMSGMLNKFGRPQKVMYNSLLSPAPIGFWHVTIGNPRHPIMSIGNMVITDVSVEHSGPLGLDDFPTGLKVTVSLTRGKPRDLRDIEKLYMQGNNRIYSSMGPKVFDMYKNAEEYKSHKKAGTLNLYAPVEKVATVNIPADQNTKPTINLGQYTNILTKMKKYFGTDDAYSIYIPAAEQECGAGKQKPSTIENSNITGSRNGK